MRIAIASLAGLLSLALAACGGSESAGSTTGGGLEEEQRPVQPTGPVNASGSEEARATVANAGGTLSLQNGARLEIPSGAIAEPTEVVLRRGAEGQAFGDLERQRSLSPMLNVEPMLVAADGGAFVVSVPAQTIPSGFEEADLAMAMEEIDDQQRAIDTLGTQTRWQFYPVEVQNGRWVARVGGLAGHRIQFGVAR